MINKPPIALRGWVYLILKALACRLSPFTLRDEWISRSIIMNYYAGIGSRETPIELKSTIKTIVEYLNKKGYILRSGGAPGADSFFEEYSENKEIFLPWRGFNNNSSILFNPTPESFNLAQKYHPNWSRLSYGAKKLMARNCHQVLGLDLKTPVKFIICWTKDGKATGGTGQALRIAEDLKIPVHNLYFKDTINIIYELIRKNEF